MVWSHRPLLLVGVILAGCQVRGLIGSNADSLTVTEATSASTTGSDTVTTTSVSDSATTDSSGDTSDTIIFDVSPMDVPMVCAPPSPLPCDADDDDPWHALGLDCPGGVEITTSFTGDADALAVIEGPLGTSEVFTPREGEKMVALSTGTAAHLMLSPTELRDMDPLGCASPLSCPSTSFGAIEPMPVLPDPLDVRRVSETRDCFDDPSLVGRGDCSNSLQDQWVQGDGAYDYVELRLQATVPENTDAVRYDFALMSSEYPSFVEHSSPYNDMYIAWLESEAWTGNVSFDEMGNPITATSVFLDYRSGHDPLNCADTPEVEELAGFAMQCHGATKWLTTIAPVLPGEDIELVFALFDLTDGTFDTVVLLDNFDWSCSGAPPITTPAG